jgi:hypothetical protein
MTPPTAAPAKLTLEIEVAGTYSRSSRYTTYEEAVQSDGKQSISRLEVTLKGYREGEQQENYKPEIYHHSVIFDPAERIKPHEFLLFPPGTGSYTSADWYSSLVTIIEKPPPPPYFLNVTKEGVEIGGTLISWGDIENNARWPEGDSFGVFVGGEYVGDQDENLLVAIEGSDNEQVRFLAPSLVAELDYLVAHGRLDSGLSSEAQIMREAQTRPEVLLELALSMPWEHARRICGPPGLALWLEENHPQSPHRKPPSQMPEESAETEEEAEWPPNNMRIAFAMFAARMAGTFSQADADRMDEGPPETWPLEIWQKLGFAPPSPAATNESPMSEPPPQMEPSDETSGGLKPELPTTAEVNIRASGDLYRITRDTTSHICDGEEVLVYDSVKVDVSIPPQDEEGVAQVLESVAFHPEDEDFPLPHIPPEPPDIGQVERTTFTSRMQADIRLANSERPNVRISRSGVTVGDHHYSWETIHERGGLDQSDPSTAYFHGVGLSTEMEDLIFHFRSGRAAPRETIIHHLANEIDFIAAHTRADGFDGSPADLVVAMHDDPEILMRAVLAMPWDYARRICGPAEVTRWIEENHPASRTRLLALRQKLSNPDGSSMKRSDSTTPREAPWPPPAPAVASAIFVATMRGQVTEEEIAAVDGLPPSKVPRELMIKLGFNPPMEEQPT